MIKKIWLDEPEDKDFPAAQDFLELHFDTKISADFVKKLKNSPTIFKKAKDIYRASNLHLLPKQNIHVKSNLKKFKNGKKLSPILLLRNENRLIIADGYHRLCASYYLSEDLEVPCRLV